MNIKSITKSAAKLAVGAALTTGLATTAQAVDTIWNGGVGEWNNPDNWDKGVPDVGTNAVIKASGSEVTLSGDPGVAAALTVGYIYRAPAKLKIESDLSVASMNVASLGNASDGEVVQTAGRVSVASGLLMGYSSSDYGRYTVSGKESSLSVTGTVTIARYANGVGRLTVTDGAAFECKAVSVVGVGTKSYGQFQVYDGASATIGSVSAEAPFALEVSNATAQITGSVTHSHGAGSASNTYFHVCKDGVLTIGGGVTFGRYANQGNAGFCQEEGSAVNLAGLTMGSASGVNLFYTMNGGTLNMSGTLILGYAAQVDVESGTATIGGNLQLANARGTASESCVRFAGDSKTEIAGKIMLQKQYDSGGGIIALETEGGRFTAKAASVDCWSASKHDKLILRPIVTQTGLAPIEITGNMKLLYPMYVTPQAKKGAFGGTWEILKWGGSLTLQNNAQILLDENVDSSSWKLTVDTANKRVLLKYTRPGMKLIFK